MHIKRLISLLLIVLAIIVLYQYGFKDYISLHALQERSHDFKMLVDRQYWYAVAVYMLGYIAVIAASLPVVAPLTLLGGFLFGFLPSALYSALAGGIGSMLAVFIFRHFLVTSLQHQFKRQLIVFKYNMQKYGLSYILILHFMTVVPFFVINALVALSDVSLFTSFWTTCVGSAPVFLLFSFQGKQLAEIQSLKDIFTFPVLLGFALLILLACMPLIIKKMRGTGDIEELTE